MFVFALLFAFGCVSNHTTLFDSVLGCIGWVLFESQKPASKNESVLCTQYIKHRVLLLNEQQKTVSQVERNE